jgi:hypothetical protein
MIIGIEGGISSGKTLSMVFFAIQEHREHGKKIFANFHLKGGLPYYYLTFDEFVSWSKTCENCTPYARDGTDYPEVCPSCGGRDFRDCIILIDEAHIWMDSRTSASKFNRLQTYLLLQTGKEGINLYYTTQSFGQVELRLRQRTDMLMHVRKATVDGETVHLLKVYDIPNNKKWRLVIHGKDVWEFFDTKEVVKVPTTLMKSARERRD